MNTIKLKKIIREEFKNILNEEEDRVRIEIDGYEKKPFRKTFTSQSAYEAWKEKNARDKRFVVQNMKRT